MKVIRTVNEMQQYMRKRKQQGDTVGFVPTMGYLHEGHLSLMDYAKEQSDFVVTSIFVNPLQFGPNEDFDQYPRDFERDEQLAREHGTDLLFYPSIEEMYPKNDGVMLKVHARTDVLCGEKRPGHFDGVVTVLTKLFHIIQPDRAFFGLKDAQQVAIVDDLIHSYFFPIELIGCPTVREEDGLAKSSRNVNLSESEREEAPKLYQLLLHAKEQAVNGADPKVVEGDLLKGLKEVRYGHVDYVQILSYPDLEPIKTFHQKTIIALAYKFENVRLIDNIIVDEQH
ncbi:pantoate--beta-alanine ligase [Pseudalkalibacillus berkeleyi]|uniref:Pantothenate synthetase n=1 Tax=Pseudalkalibacillus berkeleyi TaxID=1069813 RepID=A0ABS9H0G4_9BACL|nr:pantoate--beta-alanine ligase [Pseudalkalibacillus berkeleyi]MCF6137551.1 pantoate--beta-alanine ligase [Pseudalkalibacillus berkeleyi]